MRPVLRIRIRIRMRISPEQHVFGPPGSGSGSISQRYGSGSFYQSKNSKKNLDFYCFVTSFWLLSLENDVDVLSKSNTRYTEKLFYKLVFSLASWGSMMKIAESGYESGSISQRHGFADPDPHQNDMDPQHWMIPYLAEDLLADVPGSHLHGGFLSSRRLLSGLVSASAHDI
jgi:hypothetical protein